MIHPALKRFALCMILLAPAGFVTCIITPGDGKEEESTPPAAFDPFPFKSIANWWHYTEGNGNRLSITVIDTVRDDQDMYFKVRFEEERVDTTDDWFKQTPSAIEFSQTLAGQYYVFLPLDYSSGSSGTFTSSTGNVTYTYNDSVQLSPKTFYRALQLHYTTPVLHGFDEIVFADSIGIAALIDNSGRFPVTYTLDSAFVHGRIHIF
jgi:hypothetical protein